MSCYLGNKTKSASDKHEHWNDWNHTSISGERRKDYYFQFVERRNYKFILLLRGQEGQIVIKKRIKQDADPRRVPVVRRARDNVRDIEVHSNILDGPFVDEGDKQHLYFLLDKQGVE